MTQWYETPATLTEQGETIVVGRPAFVATFYAYEGFRDHAQAAFDAWLTLLPPKPVLHYGHGDSRRLAKLTPKAIAKVRDALSPAGVGAKFKWYFAKTSAPDRPADEPHAHSFEVFATPSSASYLQVMFPRDHVATHGVDAVVAWFESWNESFGFLHAGAGYGFEIPWFEELAGAAYPSMLRTALRYHGVRMWSRTHARFVGQTEQALDTAAWLTYLSRDAIATVGEESLAGIESGVVRHPSAQGVVLQAGPEPDPCDANRPDSTYGLLQSVNRAIVPIRTTKWWIHGFAADAEKENSWFERMDS